MPGGSARPVGTGAGAAALRGYPPQAPRTHPLKGVRSKTKWYQAFYNVVGPLYPLPKRLLPKHVTTTENVGRAMIRVVADGYSKRVLENPDINALAARVGFAVPRGRMLK